jgi:hypothetical protein
MTERKAKAKAVWLGSQEVERGEGWEDVDLRGQGAEEFYGAEAVGVEGVVDVVAEVAADGVGG